MSGKKSPHSLIRPDTEALSSVARKYRTLHELRRAHEAFGTVVDRQDARALAKAFPGALRELDTLPIDEIVARACALEAAAEAGKMEPWMAWIAAYHALMRGALRIKPRLVRAHALTAAKEKELAREASEAAGVPLHESFVRAVARPPNGRLANVVLEEMSRVFAVSVLELRRSVAPSHRRAHGHTEPEVAKGRG